MWIVINDFKGRTVEIKVAGPRDDLQIVDSRDLSDAELDEICGWDIDQLVFG